MLLLRANLLVLVFTLLTQAYGSALAPVILPRATVCNGHEEFCSRSYGNVSYVGTHNSYAFKVNALGANQDQNVTQQLNDGIRLLQMQAINKGGTIQLCHTSCSLLDGGSLQDYLSIVKTWLDANPNEVLTLLIVNINNFPSTAFDTVFRAVGLDSISYSPPTAVIRVFDWPTLGSMIDAGKRLVTFLDNAADFTTVPYLLDEFTNIWETKFGVTDPNFDCLVNRSKGDTSTEMFMINHFLDTIVLGQLSPDIANLNTTNAFSGPGSLGAQVSTCLSDQGRFPNFMLVDFYEFANGAVFEVAANINGVSYSPATPIATPVTQESGSVTSTPLNAASLLDHNQRIACIVSVMAVMIGMLIVL